jgi:predicted RNA-binding Zn-ribbon protein involved in translation (DUF1610 family)
MYPLETSKRSGYKGVMSKPKPKPKPPTRAQFDKRFPDDDACLEHLKVIRYGERFHCEKCNKEAQYYRAKARRSYACEHCGHQVYPTAGTPFHASRTSLKDWFFVMHLFCASRNGVAAKEVQRQIGVTYKTAWRMCHMIRQYMGYAASTARISQSALGIFRSIFGSLSFVTICGSLRI